MRLKGRMMSNNVSWEACICRMEAEGPRKEDRKQQREL
jgi:hypothetical protein